MGDVDWTELIGCEPEEFCNRLYHSRPDWADGMVGFLDARYLFARALEAGPRSAVEIGTASGVSTALLAHALRLAGLVNGNSGSQVSTYDIMPHFYLDESRRAGDAAREMLPEEAFRHVLFRNPATATDVAEDHNRDSIEFLFIDANHSNPWPALDMLATLPALRPGAEVVLHDINLPVKHPGFPAWGAKYLFDGLDLEKQVNEGDPVPNIGSVWVPDDKEGVRTQLLELVRAYEWETSVPPEVTAALLG